jgi:hypothetical protein
MAADLALRELGYDPNEFTVTLSQDDSYIPIIQAYEFNRLSNFLTSDEIEVLLQFYSYDYTYSRYIWNWTAYGDDFNITRALFNKSGFIPKDQSEHIIIDLRWVSPYW